MMNSVNCNLCGSTHYTILSHGRDLLLNLPGEFYLVQCCDCGLIYQNPQLSPQALARHYPDNYTCYRHEKSAEAPLLDQISDRIATQRRCNHLEKYHPTQGILLDVGCATGLFLKAMRERHWLVAGVELSAYATQYARQQFGLDVRNGTVEQANFPDHLFDVVTMWDVLEHVIDPKESLREVARILKPNGLLALSLPNPVCIEAKLFQETWVGWDQPRHLHLFSPPVLQRYFAETGFELIQIDSWGGRLGLSLMSVDFWLKSRGVSEAQSKRLTQLIYNWPLRLLTWPFYRLAEKKNQTTNMIVFARRR